MGSNFYTPAGAALTSNREDWRTPPSIFAELNGEFHFTVDAAATSANALLPRYWSRENDAFAQDWRGERVFCNPPYGRDSGRWIAKFSKSIGGGGGRNRRCASSGAHGHAGVSRLYLPPAECRSALLARASSLRFAGRWTPNVARAIP